MINILQDINKVVITAGHGGGDPGAVSGQRTEAGNVIKICQYIQQFYDNDKINNLIIEIIDPKNELNLQPAIDILNARYPAYNPNSGNNVLAIEVHQDQNAPNLPQDQQDRQMGIYYFQNDTHSQELATEMTKKFISYGAYNVQDGNPENFNGTWRRGHYLEWQGFYLGFVNNVNAWSIIIECGFVSGNNSDDDLKRFAWWIFQSLKEIKVGQSVMQNNHQLEPVTKKELMLASNPYYLGLLKDKNTDLAVKDLVDRDIEIQELKASILDLNQQVAKVEEFVAKYQSLEVEFNKMQNKVPIPSYILPNDKVTIDNVNNASQDNSGGGNFVTKKGILPNLEKGHILEVISTSGLALLAEFGTFALNNGFDFSKFEFSSNFLSLMIYWILIYIAHRLHFVIPDPVLVRIKDKLVK
jgi:N-acetylmuramoyl-L-alanine amidase